LSNVVMSFVVSTLRKILSGDVLSVSEWTSYWTLTSRSHAFESVLSLKLECLTIVLNICTLFYCFTRWFLKCWILSFDYDTVPERKASSIVVHTRMLCGCVQDMWLCAGCVGVCCVQVWMYACPLTKMRYQRIREMWKRAAVGIVACLCMWIKMFALCFPHQYSTAKIKSCLHFLHGFIQGYRYFVDMC
jgi:hypothetical protein